MIFNWQNNICTYRKVFGKGCNLSSFTSILNFKSEMPKPVTHTLALKKHRQKLKEKSQKYSPGTVNLQILGSGAKGAPRSLYIFTDQSRYLFNCGEGSQRLAHEHKMKLSKLEHIFITHPTWENIGGLPGVSLTIQDVGVPQITIHGPPGTDHIFSATRRFVVLRHLAVKMARCNKETQFEDNVMKVQYIPLYSSEAKLCPATPLSERLSPKSQEQISGSEDSSDDNVDYYAYWKTGSRPSSPTQGDSPKPSKKRKHSSPVEDGQLEWKPPGSVSMAYVCRLQDRQGTLNLQACVNEGVPPGPLLGRLKAGEDITLPSGRLVRSKDVTSPEEPGPVFIVVECPSEEFLDSLLEEESFKKYQASASNVDDVAYLIVHFTPPQIMNHPRYREWMEQFSPSTHHLILNTTNDCFGSVAVHRIQIKLHMLCDRLFPPLTGCTMPSVVNGQNCNKSDGVNEAESLNKTFSIIKGRTFNTINLRPQKYIDCSPKLLLDPELFKQEVMSVDGFPEALISLQQQLAALTDTHSGSSEFPRVVFLGTGSCIPNKTRNTSGILIHLSDSKCMVVDCGEGTYGQIVRLYGAERSEVILKNLKAIYVSHLHADHHIGLIGLLKERLRVCRGQSQSQLFLLAPHQIRSWLRTYNTQFEPILQGLQLVPNAQLLYNDLSLKSSTLEELQQVLGLSSVRTCFVQHCPNAFGISFTHADSWKITYSGDTMPCEELANLGKGSNLLIHEATMEDDLEEEAKLKMHSTTSQAIYVGHQMEAKFILLTHFSQRYAKVPIFNDSFSANVGIAFDNMQVTLSDLPKLPLMYRALKLMFAEHYEEMELRAIKRQLQQEREQART